MRELIEIKNKEADEDGKKLWWEEIEEKKFSKKGSKHK